jgi:hypothetical protein
MNKQWQFPTDPWNKFRILEDEWIIARGFIDTEIQAANKKSMEDRRKYLEFIISYLSVKFDEARTREVIDSSNARANKILEQHKRLANQQGWIDEMEQIRLRKKMENERERLSKLKKVYPHIDKIPSK